MFLVVDNYDSFTYNLVQYLGELGAEPLVVRNDELTLDEVAALAPEAIVLGPGPGVPADAGLTVPIIQRFGAVTPILGVCLGHQAIGEAYGGRVIRAPRGVMHGKTSQIAHDGTALFEGVPSPLEVMRYHSLVVERASLPRELYVTATATDDATEIHALQHATHPVLGVQFHPESIGTPEGMRILKNFLAIARVSVAVLAMGFLSACGGDAASSDSSETPWTYTADSSSDTVRVRIAGAVPDRLVRTLVPELSVGAQDGAEEETFGSVNAVFGTTDGGLLVYDPQAGAVRLFDSTGAFVRQVGAKGGGPGEYGWINGIVRLPSGGWVLWDAEGGRLNHYTAAGDFTTSFRAPFTGWYFSDGLRIDTEGHLHLWSRLTRDPKTSRVLTAGFLRVDSLGVVLDTLVVPSWGPEADGLTAQSPDGRSITSIQLPWSGGSESALTRTGGLVSGEGTDYVFYLLPRNGRPVRVEREYTPIPVSSTEASERKAQITQQMRRVNPAWVWTGPEIPATKPAYGELLAAEDGRVWVRLWTAGEPIPAAELPPRPATPDPPIQLTTREPNLYDVFASDGRLLGRVAPPPRTTLLQMNGNQAWGVTLDSLDVAYAVRFRISPPLPR